MNILLKIYLVSIVPKIGTKKLVELTKNNKKLPRFYGDLVVEMSGLEPPTPTLYFNYNII